MRSKAFKVGILCCLIISLVLALCLIPIGGVPAVALSLDEYFVISHDVSFSKNEVYRGEVFYATVTTQATCIKDLPLPISETFVTGRVVAQHEESGAELILNSGYTVSINPFPVEKEGDVIQVSQLVPLQFPVGSHPGSYNVVGEVIEARAKAILWFTITSYLPSSQSMGSVTYLPDRGDSSNPTSPDLVEPAPSPDLVEPAPSPDLVEPAPSPDPVEPVSLPDPVEPVSLPDPVEPVSLPDPVEPAPSPDPVELVSLPDPVELVSLPDPVELVSLPDPVEPVPSPDPVEPAPSPLIPTTTLPKSTNWWLVGSIYTVNLALLVTILWLIRQRRQQQ